MISFSKTKNSSTKIAFLLILLFAACKITFAQQSGCVVYNGAAFGGYQNRVVYSTPTGTTFSACGGGSGTVPQYAANSGSPIISTCPIRPPVPEGFRQCAIGNQCGVLLQNYITTCPLDKNIIFLMVLLSAIGYFKIRSISIEKSHVLIANV